MFLLRNIPLVTLFILNVIVLHDIETLILSVTCQHFFFCYMSSTTILLSVILPVYLGSYFYY